MTKTYEQHFPTLDSPQMRLAQLAVEALMGAGGRMMPDCSCPDDQCIKVWCEHGIARACPHLAEDEPMLQPPEPVIEWHERYRVELVRYAPLNRMKPNVGVGPVYEWAGLKRAEGDAVAMHHTGFKLATIAAQLDREETAARQLIVNGVWRIERALWLAGGLVGGIAHCEICGEAKELLQRSPKVAKARSA